MEVRLDIAEEALKVFVAALQCLSQVGKELSIECDPGARRLTLRALNDAHSASGQVVLDRTFFAESQGGRSVTLAGVDIASNEMLRAHFNDRTPFVKCKVFAKSCCNVFRTLKHVQSVQLALLVDQDALDQATAASQDDTSQASEVDEVDLDCMELTWRLRCDFDITKTHHMKVQACQIMRAVFDKSSSPSRWRTRQHHLSSLLTHIHHSGEVSVTCSPTHVKFESYFSNFTDSKAQLQTETAVESLEFSEYILQPPADDSVDAAAQLIFCIKEIRVGVAGILQGERRVGSVLLLQHSRKPGAVCGRVDVYGQVLHRDDAVHRDDIPASVITDAQRGGGHALRQRQRQRQRQRRSQSNAVAIADFFTGESALPHTQQTPTRGLTYNTHTHIHTCCNATRRLKTPSKYAKDEVNLPRRRRPTASPSSPHTARPTARAPARTSSRRRAPSCPRPRSRRSGTCRRSPTRRPWGCCRPWRPCSSSAAAARGACPRPPSAWATAGGRARTWCRPRRRRRLPPPAPRRCPRRRSRCRRTRRCARARAASRGRSGAGAAATPACGRPATGVG